MTNYFYRGCGSRAKERNAKDPVNKKTCETVMGVAMCGEDGKVRRNQLIILYVIQAEARSPYGRISGKW